MANRRRQTEQSTRATAAHGSDAHFVVVRVGEEKLGFDLAAVSEIVRVQNLAHMPLAPKSLLGLANMRGTVLPVISLRRLLRFPDAPIDDAARIVVINRGSPVGFVVDRVEALLEIPAAQLTVDRAGAGVLDPDMLDGVVKGEEGTTTIKIVSPERMLRGEFDRIGVSASRAEGNASATSKAVATAAAPSKSATLVSFDMGGQEYALPLERVNEIVSMPAHVSEIAGPESAVLGVITLRNRLLPLVSLRALLGLAPRSDGEERGKIIIVSMGNTSVGVVADRTREILRIDLAAIDPAPALLTRGTGDAEIESICRLEGGERLVAVLSPDRLFRSELVSRILSQASNDNVETEATSNGMSDEKFIVFRLGIQEYGMPISAVVEVTRAPDRMTRMPKAPAFIEGVINLRGTVLPIVDLRRRFEIASHETSHARRILVIAVGGTPTGFIVDAVSELLSVPPDAIQPAPELSPEQMRLIGRVANLNDGARIILLVDPRELLDEGEASDVAALASTASSQRSSIS
jgi:purine-binding chemotaxis protein CheW